jgi:hypothetical protein
MTTISKYESSLTYKPSFNANEERVNKKIYVTVDDQTKSQYMRMCMGTSPEEVLFTIRSFKNTVLDMGLELTDKQALPTFLSVLGSNPRQLYSDMVEELPRSNRPAFNGDFKPATEAFIKAIVEDPKAKESVLIAFADGKTFAKPMDVEVKKHYERIMELCYFVDLLPGDRQEPLHREEKRNIFFNTFPKSWRDEFKQSAHDITTSTVQSIKEWMQGKKEVKDKEHSKKRKAKDNDSKDKKSNKKGKKSGANNICSIHGGHPWKDCKLNRRSKNFNQAAYDRHQQSGGRGFQGGRGYHGGRGFQGRGGRGFQGRGYQPRDQYYQHHHPPQQEQYQNGPPSSIHTDQSHAASSYHPPAGQNPYQGYN